MSRLQKINPWRRLQKIKPWRSKKYKKWIRSLPCVATGCPADDAHHILGTKLGGMGAKISDHYCIPLTRAQHKELHHDPEKWEQKYGLQEDHLAEIAALAVVEGKLEGFEAWVAGL